MVVDATGWISCRDKLPAGWGSGGLKKLPSLACDVLGGAFAADQIKRLRCRQALINEAFGSNQDGGGLVATSGDQDLIEQGVDFGLLGRHGWLAVGGGGSGSPCLSP